MECIWSKCEVFVWHLQLAFQMEHNLHSENMTVSVKGKKKNLNEDKMERLRKIFSWGRTWHPKWHEDLLSGVRVSDGLQQRAWKLPHAAWSQTFQMYEGGLNLSQRMAAELLTCLIFWASHSYTGQQRVIKKRNIVYY